MRILGRRKFAALPTTAQPMFRRESGLACLWDDDAFGVEEAIEAACPTTDIRLKTESLVAQGCVRRLKMELEWLKKTRRALIDDASHAEWSVRRQCALRLMQEAH